MPHHRQANNLYHSQRKQNGAALIVMLVIMVMGIAAVLVGSLSTSTLQTAHQKTTAAALAQAKNALIGYAITYGDTHPGEVHGYLPCPDTDASNGEGSSKLSCGSKNISVVGRLPWRSLGLAPLRDGNGECLWYAVSGTYKNNSKTDLMNWDNTGLFEVMASDGASYLAGSTADNRAVAVIFAPSAILGNQDRSSTGSAPTCGGNYTASNYLDNDTVHSINNSSPDVTNPNAVSRFIAGLFKDASDNVIVNDRVIFITRDDIFNAIMRRADFVDPARNPLLLMTNKAAKCIADYGRNNSAGSSDKRLPWSGRPSPAIGTDCSYRDGSNTSTPPQIMYGRLPNRVSGSRSSTSNLITQSSCSGTNSYYQLKSDGSNCPSVPDWNTYYPWWSNWKDHVFYTLANDYRPAAGSNPSCGTCLKVNGSGSYAAVVMFSGRRLSTQTRATDADRINFANYLEGNNLISNTPINTSGNGNYQSGAETGSFNDVLYCINPDLTVTPC